MTVISDLKTTAAILSGAFSLTITPIPCKSVDNFDFQMRGGGNRMAGNVINGRTVYTLRVIGEGSQFEGRPVKPGCYRVEYKVSQ